MRKTATLLAALLVLGSGKLDVLDLFAGLPERVVVESQERVEEDRIYRLRSAEPIERSAAGHSIYGLL